MTHRYLSEVTHIGIDEIPRKRGHVYVTNVYDLKHRCFGLHSVSIRLHSLSAITY